ncbi:ribbon-helix-helix domain-containing protein [Corynebacterium comes]|uniref:Ribbon-helix-helix protein, copG family n=1 Tax=Corynebacterium comes TaxID=2675218 RepID=A0A6B8W4P6_9CORY|nr:ribbon-helix-helix domain-containing protein [Corynebacterium comes]QGU05906.1 Ribbon-helix-helix protein, copG family [Corynebacterium comes]
MTDTTHSPQQPSRVVSVRLDTATIARLDRLAERTSRSRGFYLKAAIQAMLPVMGLFTI